MSASYLRMKWRQGLAVITRTEHWDMASQHLWGLSSSDIAAYLHSPHPQNAPASGDSLRNESCSEISDPGVKGPSNTPEAENRASSNTPPTLNFSLVT